jgi:YYY domain-containing protein
MLDFLAWWLAVSVLSLAVFPVAFRLFRCLPDRGYAFAKPLGLLLASYLLWILATLGVLANDRGSIILIGLALVLVGLCYAGYQRLALLAYLRANYRYVLVVEAVFLVVFVWFAVLRAYAPDIYSTEKPFELAFLNGVSRSHFFPPSDPWYGGQAMNYYYFGWVNVSLLDKLTGVANGVGFNLGTPLTAALAAATIFGLVFSLVRGLAASRVRRLAIAVGLLAVVLLLVIGSLEGVLELAAAHGVGSAAFYQRLGINGLPVLNQQGTLQTTSTWYPNDQWSFWWWWRATRMASSWNIMEFPFFSFMLGDLHPHVMVIPFALLSLGFTWSIFASGDVLDGSWWRRNLLLFAVFGIVLGSLGLLNTWDLPTEFLILCVIAAFANARRLGAWGWPLLRATALFLLPLLLLAIGLYLPFWAIFKRPDFLGISPTMLTQAPDPVIRAAMDTPPLHLLLFWGPLLWLSLAFLVVHARRTGAFQLGARYLAWPLLLACLPFRAWMVMVTGRVGVSGLGAELSARGADLLSVLLLTLLVFLALSALMREALPDGHGRLPAFAGDWENGADTDRAGSRTAPPPGRNTGPESAHGLRSQAAWYETTPYAALAAAPIGAHGASGQMAAINVPASAVTSTTGDELVTGDARAQGPPLADSMDGRIGSQALPEAAAVATVGSASAPVLFALVAVAVGLLFLLGAELFFVLEAQAPARANTVFKFWYQAWILLSAGNALGLAYAVRGWRPRLLLHRPPRLAWAAVTLALLLAALVYPVTASFARTNGFSGSPTLNGLAYWQHFDPADYAAAMWLAAHAQGTPVLLEAEGGQLAGTYSPEGGRISELSGLPTVLGWSDHEWQERNSFAATQARSADIRTIYTTSNTDQALQLLARYNVRYVVVGQLERQTYPGADFAKFAKLGAPVYQTPQITIYDLGG